MSQARVSRRRFLETGLAMPVTGSLLMERAVRAAVPEPSPTAGIYQRLGIRTPINAVGTWTTLSGTSVSRNSRARRRLPALIAY